MDNYPQDGRTVAEGLMEPVDSVGDWRTVARRHTDFGDVDTCHRFERAVDRKDKWFVDLMAIVQTGTHSSSNLDLMGG